MMEDASGVSIGNLDAAKAEEVSGLCGRKPVRTLEVDWKS